MRIKILFIFVISSLCVTIANAQGGNQDIDIKFLKAKFGDTTVARTFTVFFLISTPDSSSFPPRVTLPPKCTVFENGREHVVLLAPQMLSVGLFDEKIKENKKEYYELLKNQIAWTRNYFKNRMIITYTITNTGYMFRKMSLTPKFGNKFNKEIQIDKRCEFVIE